MVGSLETTKFQHFNPFDSNEVQISECRVCPLWPVMTNTLEHPMLDAMSGILSADPDPNMMLSALVNSKDRGLKFASDTIVVKLR
mmetsp:Transcript_31051/g.41036  ORF Transcript_31051/g.41036 Transcript_31051/m.41036 type:complete len:85 (+) Transcript_31051:1493-1747(+)